MCCSVLLTLGSNWKSVSINHVRGCAQQPDLLHPFTPGFRRGTTKRQEWKQHCSITDSMHSLNSTGKYEAFKDTLTSSGALEFAEWLETSCHSSSLSFPTGRYRLHLSLPGQRMRGYHCNCQKYALRIGPVINKSKNIMVFYGKRRANECMDHLFWLINQPLKWVFMICYWFHPLSWTGSKLLESVEGQVQATDLDPRTTAIAFTKPQLHRHVLLGPTWLQELWLPSYIPQRQWGSMLRKHRFRKRSL